MTFRACRAKWRAATTIIRFVIVTLGTLTLSQLSLWGALGLGIGPAPGKIASILVTFGFGFLLNKLFVFDRRLPWRTSKMNPPIEELGPIVSGIDLVACRVWPSDGERGAVPALMR